jgi:NhaA family Na+:H+ antiporter
MIGAMVLALAVANSPLEPLYYQLHHAPVHVRFGGMIIGRPLVEWINEGLMTFFFLAVGLEIKRQLLEGHLASRKAAALPAVAAIGGIVTPAAVYAAVTWGDPVSLKGWAIPTATDIVLALGALSLLGASIPAALKVFLTALAIFDDLAAILIIGLFYGAELALYPVAIAALSMLGLLALNKGNVRRLLPYGALGLVLWAALLKSGIEATLAGVLVGLAVPLHAAERGCGRPLRDLERRLHPWVALLVVPLFAFFNAGIVIDPAALEGVPNPVPLAIIAGLFLGKQVGVMSLAWLAVKADIAALPRGVGWQDVYGIALLAGTGFTMSLFVTTLAFTDPTLRDEAKLAIIVGSLLSAISGLAWLYCARHGRPAKSSRAC